MRIAVCVCAFVGLLYVVCVRAELGMGGRLKLSEWRSCVLARRLLDSEWPDDSDWLTAAGPDETNENGVFAVRGTLSGKTQRRTR